MNPLAYLRVAEILAGLALVAGICWGAHQFLEHERDIGRNEVRAEYAQKLQEEKDRAKLREDVLRGQVADAVTKGNDREQTLRTVAAGSTAASVGLRDALGTLRDGVSGATIEALRNSTATLSTVLADCQGRYRSLAEVTDRHASDARTLSDAWPENQVAPEK